MTTEITVNNNQDGTIWFVLKPDTEVVVGRHYEDKRMMISMSLPESDVLKMRDYLNEKYPVKHETKGNSMFFHDGSWYYVDENGLIHYVEVKNPVEQEEPTELGMYITQSGKFVYHNKLSCGWSFFEDGNVYAYAWDALKETLGTSEFPLRKAKAVAE